MADLPEQELPTNKIHDYVTWPENRQIFDDGRGGLAFPAQNNSGCHRDGSGNLVSLPGKPVTMELHVGVSRSGEGIPLSAIDFMPDSPVILGDSGIGVTVKKFDTELGQLETVDEIPYGIIDINKKVSFVPVTPDSLERTTIVGNIVELTAWSGSTSTMQFAVQGIKYPFTMESGITFALMLPVATHKYVYLGHQEDPSENGVYQFTGDSYVKVADEPVRTTSEEGEKDPHEILGDPTVNDNVECCDHFRKTYSHREVHDRVDSLVGHVTGFGVKSASSRDCDGGFVDWFINGGQVNIGNGHESIFVDGFGLGTSYQASSENIVHETALPKDDYVENDGTLHPLLEWAYGTRFDSKNDVDISALPRDWPFTFMNSTQQHPVFNDVGDTSNITLVKGCAEGVGNLERDVEYEAIDPTTHQPVIDIKHVFNNRHHIVLYPDYQPIVGKDNAVVVKPLFIHLPATLDTKDGETVDITVSIQNVDQEAFGAPNSAAALSGYYAAMSQPRVYVMGGTQKFSNRRMEINKDSIQLEDGYYTVTTKTPAYAYDKVTQLDCTGGSVDVRANIVCQRSDGSVRSYTAHGQLISNDGGATIKFSGEFPYAKDMKTYSNRWKMAELYICGMAYLDGQDSPSKTPMGLVSRDYEMLRGDMGSGTTGSLDQYNRFYSINQDDGRVDVPNVDKRHVLATVYQTATSTFPWALANRRKMATLDRSWTDEAHRSSSSVLKMVYDQNVVLDGRLRDDIMSGYFDSSHYVTAASNPLSYRRDQSSWNGIGSALRVNFPDSYDSDPVTAPSGNPARQGKRAMRMLSSDLLHMRLLAYKNGQKARVRVDGISLGNDGTWPSETDVIVSKDTGPVSSSVDWVEQLVQSSWCSSVRSLPDYVINADSYASNSAFFVPDAQIFNADWDQYVSDESFPYNRECSGSQMESSACTVDDGTLPGTTEEGLYECEKFSRNSLLESLVPMGTLVWRQKYNEACRYAETALSVKLDIAEYMDLSNLDDMDKDWMRPFTNIRSVDAVPAPDISSSMAVYQALTAAQHEFVSSDAVQMYRYETDGSGDGIDEVSTVMPTDSDLAKFLESYVAAYGAKAPKHFYQGSRVLLKNGRLTASNPDEQAVEHAIYLRTIDRVQKRFGSKMSQFEVEHYIADNFADIKTSKSRDPNVDSAKVDMPSISVSVPPYTAQDLHKNATYTRVIMQFTFSQKAGRWYTTGYRQYPTNYLSPLYGADALGIEMPSLYDTNGNVTLTVRNGELKPLRADGTVPKMPLWVNSACSGMNSYRDHMYRPYSVVPAMDMNLGSVPFMTGDYESTVFAPYTDAAKGWEVGKLKPEYDTTKDTADTASLALLERPYRPLTANGTGGINLYPPAEVHGGYKVETDAGVHANFWSVRKYIRPAVSVLDGTDIPAHDEPDDDTPKHKNGAISDPTLYRMFDFPLMGTVQYKLPNPIDPDIDDNEHYLLYHDTEDGIIKDADRICLGYAVPEQDQ